MIIESGVEVQGELVRMRAQPSLTHFSVILVIDPGLYQVLGEYIALEQELVIVLEILQRCFQRSRHCWNLREFRRSQGVNILVERLTRIELALNTIEPGHQHC